MPELKSEFQTEVKDEKQRLRRFPGLILSLPATGLWRLSV